MCRYDHYLLDDIHDWHGDYDDVHTDHGWEVDSFFRPPRVPEQDHVWLDPHILANPAIADIDGDGQEELVIAVSYFFDRDQYSGPVSSALLGVHFWLPLCSTIDVAQSCCKFAFLVVCSNTTTRPAVVCFYDYAAKLLSMCAFVMHNKAPVHVHC